MSSSGSDVEFLEPDGSVAPPEAAPGPRVRRLSRSWLAFLLAVAGAALAVVASFTRAYRVRFPGFDGGEPINFSLDGWGRYEAGSDFSRSGHGARLGLVYCVAAAVVLVGLGLWFVASRRGPRWRTIGNGAIVLAAGAVVATGVSLLLIALSVLDNYRTAIRSNSIGADQGDLKPNDVDLSLGPLLWLSVASGVLLIAAVLVRPRDRAGDAVEPLPPPAPSPPAPMHRDDELLG